MFRRNKDKSGLNRISAKELENRAESLERKRITAMASLKSLEKQREKFIEAGRKADQLERRNIAFRLKSIDGDIAAQKKLLSRVELASVALQKLKSIKSESGDLEEVKKITSDVDLEQVERALSERSLSDEEMLAKLSGIANLNQSTEPPLSDPLEDYMDLWNESEKPQRESEEEIHGASAENAEPGSSKESEPSKEKNDDSIEGDKSRESEEP